MSLARSIAVLCSALCAVMTIHMAALAAARDRREGGPALPGVSCGTAARQTWTLQEQWVWECVCRGAIADFNRAEGYGGTLDPKKPEGWPPNRILRPEFLATILVQEPYRSALPHQGVRIAGGWFKEPLDLSSATLMHELWLYGSRFDADVTLRALRSPLILLDDSKFTGQLHMDGLQVGSYLFMRGADFAEVILRNARIGGTLEMNGATVTGPLNMNGATVTGPLNMNSLRVGGNLLMRDTARFAEVILSNAHIGGWLEMEDSTVTGPLNMNSLKVDGHLVMNGATVTGPLNMDSVEVDNSLLMRDTARFAEVRLPHAHIKGTLEMDRSKFTGQLHGDT